MESIGKKLSDARNSRGLTIEQVSRETNISTRYIESLETENFTVFPGEPYLLGFLRNYSEYLGLNSAEFITAYKNIKIQESPVPLKELMPKRTLTDNFLSTKPSTRKAFFTVPLVIILVGALGFGIYAYLQKKALQEPLAPPSRTPANYELTKGEIKPRLYADDNLVIKIGEQSWKLNIVAVAPSFKVSTPIGLFVLDLGEDLLLDLNEDGNPDVSIFVADLYKNDPSRGAEVHFSLDFIHAESTAPVDAATVPNADLSLVSSQSQVHDGVKQQVFFEGGSAYPVTLNATFRGYCLFRYETDRTTREERYFQKAELLTIQAKNNIRIWASNGNSVKIQLVAGGKTVDLELSRPGEVIVRDLKWIKDDETGRFKFIAVDVE